MLSPHIIGVLLATGCAITNVTMDVMQKRALLAKPLYPTILFERFVVLAMMTSIAIVRLMQGHEAPWSRHVLAVSLGTPRFVPMMILDCVLLVVSAILYYRALQIAPLSLTVPFLACTPAFLLVTSHLVLEEPLSLAQVEGVAVVVFGSLLMYRSQFTVGWTEPLLALAREPGSRYMLLAALIMSLTNSLEKWLVVRSDVYSFAWLYALGSSVLMSLVALLRSVRHRESYRYLAWGAIAGGGVADATTLALQFAALVYLPAVVTIGIKRSGILLSVLAGWLFFRERHIASRLVAAAVMVCGAMMLSFSLSLLLQTGLMFATLLLGTMGPTLVRNVKARASRQSSINYRQDL